MIPLILLSSCRCSGRTDKPQVRIGEHTWRVELATDDQSRRQGLSGRDEVPEGTGMLFVFDREEALTFHMLNCRTGIDVAFISQTGRIVSIYTMAVEDNPRKPRFLYSSGHPAKFALEVAGGTFKQLNVKAGDKVELPNLRP
ncbi:MAG: DUF192 domain-containing protein [Planctomycetota bacterium]|nr:DUF192 domain-containing protein [Planctomycetota bacterium]